MKLQFLGHACFLLDDGVHKVLTDPFLTGGGHPEWAEKVDPDVIFVTHGHGDHVGDAAAIARRLLHSGSGGCGVCPCGGGMRRRKSGRHGPPVLWLR